MRLDSVAFVVAVVIGASGCATSHDGPVTGDDGRLSTRAGASSDDQAPEFPGVGTVTALDATRATVQWAPAKDDRTPPAVIAYRIYVAPTEAEFRYETPFATSPAGATTYGIGGLPAGRSSVVVVRAVDASGNEDANTKAVTVTTADLPAPVLTVKRVLLPASSLHVSWSGPGNEALAANAGVHFELCWGATAAACNPFVPMRATPEGAADVGVYSLSTRTETFVAVRTVDRAGTASAVAVASATTATSYAADVVPMLKAKCNTCHNGGFAPGPITRTWLLGRNAGTPGGTAALKCGTTAPLLTPFDATQSLVYTKMLAGVSCGARMPPGATYDAAHDARAAILGDWITQGAVNN